MIDKITSNISIGEKQDSLNEKLLKQLRINYILNVNEVDSSEENRITKKLGIEYLWCPIPSEKVTSMQMFKKDLKAASYILEDLAKIKTNNILIHCCSGIDRAPLIVALYLSRIMRITVAETYQFIKQQRKHIMEHYEWILDDRVKSV